jgi:N-acetylglucosamine-6-phosphate deacetylase
MSEQAAAILGGPIATRDGVVDGCAVVVRGTRIDALVGEHSVPQEMPRFDVGGRLVTPGLIDVHMHGALGHSFGAPAPEAHPIIMRYLLSQGVTSVQPTLSTTTPARLLSQLERLAGLDRGAGEAQMLGLHLEGPFLAPAQRGAHPLDLLQVPTAAVVDRILEHRDQIGMMTLAPEIEGGLDLVTTLVDAGVAVALGHSDADAGAFRAALDRGATHLTHLWSGQSNVHRIGPWRQPGMVELSLASEDLTAEVIADGAHLPPELLEIARRCLGDRLCVVSDSIEAAGLPEGTHFSDGNVHCVVQESVSMVVGEDSFAGSVTQVNRMLHHLGTNLGWSVQELVAMTTAAPARAAGVSSSKGTLAPGYDADISVFDADFGCFAAMVAGDWEYGPFVQGVIR